MGVPAPGSRRYAPGAHLGAGRSGPLASAMTAESPVPAGAARFRPASLDALNFLLADVRGALGPYLNVYLVTQQGWSQSAVGLITTVSGLVGLAAQTPAGALIDTTRAKRGIVALALAVLAAAALVVYAAPRVWPVL